MPRTLFLFILAILTMGCHRGKEIPMVDDVTSQAREPKAAEAPKSQTPNLYSVAVFSPERDPKADLISTMELNEGTGKRIILEIGGDW